jgi:hypothetical protein
MDHEVKLSSLEKHEFTWRKANKLESPLIYKWNGVSLFHPPGRGGGPTGPDNQWWYDPCKSNGLVASTPLFNLYAGGYIPDIGLGVEFADRKEYFGNAFVIQCYIVGSQLRWQAEVTYKYLFEMTTGNELFKFGVEKGFSQDQDTGNLQIQVYAYPIVDNQQALQRIVLTDTTIVQNYRPSN